MSFVSAGILDLDAEGEVYRGAGAQYWSGVRLPAERGGCLVEAVGAGNHDGARLPCIEVVSRGGIKVDGNISKRAPRTPSRGYAPTRCCPLSIERQAHI